MSQTSIEKKVDVRSITLCSLFAALTAIGAFIKIPLPIIPFTLQFFFTALAGVLLGSRKGGISQMIYVLVGLAGVPVFTKGGGIQYVLEPTFGYLIGFIVCAYAIGKCVEKFKVINTKNLLIACLVGLIVVYIFGVVHMYLIYNFYIQSPMGIGSAIMVGAISAAPGDIVLCIITAVVGSRIIPILRNSRLV